MAISQPDFLHVFGESSGLGPITNYGSQTIGYAIDAQATESTDFTWNPGGGPYNTGYLQSLQDNGSTMPWLASASTTPGASLETINFSIGFRVTAFTVGSFLAAPTGSTTDNNIRINVTAPSGAGDFNLDCYFNAGVSASMTTIADLSFGTDYILSGSCDVSTPTAVQARFKLGAGSVDAPATVDMFSFSFEDAWPRLLRRTDFSDFFGMEGRLNLFVYQRGGTAWDNTDLGAINSNPTTAFATWWPGGSSPAIISSPTPSGTLGTSTTATVAVTTDTNIGDLYVVLSTTNNVAGASAVQIKAGQNSSGSAAAFANNAAVSTTNPSVGFTGLTPNTLYYYAAVQNTVDGDSNIVSGTFTTAAISLDRINQLGLLGVR